MISPVTIDGPRMPVRDLVGGFIGKYRVLRQLGKGGMGTVYEAVHNEIGQRAAIKVLHAKLADDTGYAKRFLDEARAVSIVDHPGLVKVFDFNQSSDGTVYLMMEYLEGEPLWQRMTRLRERGERMSRTEVMRISRQLASALAAVHAKGIVHRDLKPDNIVIVADPDTAGGERVKILDFGIAKFNEGAEGRRQTTTGTAIGTPTYMSPEQCEGLPKISDRADTYSLGVMLFEMLTGNPPFQAEGTASLLRQHIVKPPPPLPPTVPAGLAALVSKMLSKEPALRPSMAELVLLLDRAELLSPSEHSGGATASRVSRRWVVALSVMFALGAGLAGVAAWRSRQPTPRVDVKPAVQPIAPTELPKVEVPRIEPPKPPVIVVPTPPIEVTSPPPVTTKPKGVSKKGLGGAVKIQALPDKRKSS